MHFEFAFINIHTYMHLLPPSFVMVLCIHKLFLYLCIYVTAQLITLIIPRLCYEASQGVVLLTALSFSTFQISESQKTLKVSDIKTYSSKWNNS